MIKALKWAHKLGYDQARNSLIKEIERAQSDHSKAAEVAHYRAEDKYNKPKMSEKEHQVASQILYDLLTSLDPERYPNFDRYMEKFL